MAIKITQVRLMINYCYIIQGESTILIDGGYPNAINTFKNVLEKNAVEPEEIQLILLTHGHWDHICSVKDIQEATGAKIALHHAEKDWLEQGLKPNPPPVNTWGRILAWGMGFYMPYVNVPPVEVDIVMQDEGMSLRDHGIPGEVIYTPGHSSGSVSVILDSGEAFVGDLAMNLFPLRIGPGLPIFAEDLDAVRESWIKLFDLGVKTIYPAHGGPFPVEVMQRALANS